MTHTPGFTLIELLVVVLIIGILAAAAVPQYQKAVWKSRYASVKALARSMADAEEIYYLANGEYTTDVDALSLALPAGVTCTPDASANYLYCTLPNGMIQLSSSSKYVESHLYLNNQKFISYQINFQFNTWAADTQWCFARHPLADTICQGETYVSTPSSINTEDGYRGYMYP